VSDWRVTVVRNMRNPDKLQLVSSRTPLS
jgi:hypothetical protein